MAAEIPDIEKIVSKYLRSVSDLRVVAHPPEDKTIPWVMVTMYDAPSRSSGDHVIDFHVQLDCYAGGSGGLPEATAIMREARAKLSDIDKATHEDAVINSVRVYGSQRVMDTKLDPARDRYVVDATIVGHAV